MDVVCERHDLPERGAARVLECLPGRHQDPVPPLPGPMEQHRGHGPLGPVGTLDACPGGPRAGTLPSRVRPAGALGLRDLRERLRAGRAPRTLVAGRGGPPHVPRRRSPTSPRRSAWARRPLRSLVVAGARAAARHRRPTEGQDHQGDQGNDKTSQDICNAYSAGTGACGAGGATCRYGRRHVCAVCDEGHQAFEAHPDKYSPPAGFKPKSGGGRGKKRKQ